MINIERKKDDDLKIDISSLVDVLFTLLIFFSLTSTFTDQHGMKVDLPSASSSGTLTETRKIMLTIDESGNVSINDKGFSIEELKKELAKIDKTERNNYLIVLNADKMVYHGSVAEVMNLLRTMGYTDLAIATRDGE